MKFKNRLKLMSYRAYRESDGLFSVLKPFTTKKIYGLMNSDGKLMADYKYVFIDKRDNFLFMKKHNERYDILNVNTKKFVAENVRCKVVSNGMHILNKDFSYAPYALFDTNKEDEPEFIFDKLEHITTIGNDHYFIANKHNDEKEGVLKNFDVFISYWYETIRLSEYKNLLELERYDGKTAIIDVKDIEKGTDAAEIYDFIDYDFFDKFQKRVKKDNKWGVMESSGKLSIPFKYDSMEEFVALDEQEEKGKWIPYKDIIKFSVVSIDNKYGLIDSDGKEILPCIFDKIQLPIKKKDTLSPRDKIIKLEISNKSYYITPDYLGFIIQDIKSENLTSENKDLSNNLV